MFPAAAQAIPNYEKETTQEYIHPVMPSHNYTNTTIICYTWCHTYITMKVRILGVQCKTTYPSNSTDKTNNTESTPWIQNPGTNL